MLVWEIDESERLGVAAAYGAPDYDHGHAFLREVARLEEVPFKPLVVVRFRVDDEPWPRSLGDAARRLADGARLGAKIPDLGMKVSTFHIGVAPSRLERVTTNVIWGFVAAALDVHYVRVPAVATWDEACAVARQIRAAPVPRLDELRENVLRRIG